jgi:integrase
LTKDITGVGAIAYETACHDRQAVCGARWAYYGPVDFANLKPSSRALYRTVLDPIAKRDGHRLVRDMPRDKARKIIEEISATRPGMANLTRKALRRLMTYAIDTGLRNDNPVAGIKQYKLRTRHTWIDTELAAYEAHWPLGTRERLAYSLLVYLGQRVGDTVNMRRSDISNGAITVAAQEKTDTPSRYHCTRRCSRRCASIPSKGFT